MTMRLLGVFDDGLKAAAAVTAVRGDNTGEVLVYSPTPNHAIDSALDTKVSPVRTFTLVGGLLGCVCGFALPIYTVLDWPLITGGKSLISIPAFVVIAFELTILFGAIAGFAGFLGLSGLLSLKKKAVDDPRFSNDRFGVLVTFEESQRGTVLAHLKDAGAEEVKSHA